MVKVVAPVLLALCALATPAAPAFADGGIQVQITTGCRRVYVLLDPHAQPGVTICP